MKLVLSGEPFGKALEISWTDTLVKHRHFLMPIQMKAFKRKAAYHPGAPAANIRRDNDEEASWPNKEWKKWNAEKRKGKGKGKKGTKRGQ